MARPSIYIDIILYYITYYSNFYERLECMMNFGAFLDKTDHILKL